VFDIHVWLEDEKEWLFDSVAATDEEKARAIANKLAQRHNSSPAYAYVFEAKPKPKLCQMYRTYQ
jgi:hypothetical protein